MHKSVLMSSAIWSFYMIQNVMLSTVYQKNGSQRCAFLCVIMDETGRWLNKNPCWFDGCPLNYMCFILQCLQGAGIAQWLDRHSWLKGCGFESLQERWENFLLQGWLSVLALISVSVPPHVTIVACKRSRSFCQKCRWQVTAKHAYPLHMWFAWSLHGCMVYTELAPRWLQFQMAPAMPSL